MFVPIGEAVRRSLEILLDELVDFLHHLPPGETRAGIERQIHKLEEEIEAQT